MSLLPVLRLTLFTLGVHSSRGPMACQGTMPSHAHSHRNPWIVWWGRSCGVVLARFRRFPGWSFTSRSSLPASQGFLAGF
jgi:hypothetical protein